LKSGSFDANVWRCGHSKRFRAQLMAYYLAFVYAISPGVNRRMRDHANSARVSSAKQSTPQDNAV